MKTDSPTTHRRPRSRPMRWCWILVTVVLVAACGVGPDKSPRSIGTSLSTTTTAPESGGNGVRVWMYYVADDALVPVAAMVGDRTTTTLLTELLKPLPKETTDIAISTAIPSNTKLLSVAQNKSVLTVDLSSEFANIVGVTRQRAMAQIVLTVTQQRGVDSVRFKVDGENIQIASPVHGDSTSVTACDYVDMLASPDQAELAGLPREVLFALNDRRNSLSPLCGGS